jgi:hypothetical protein
VIMAYGEEGNGVDQLGGFLELPAALDESSAGWPLDQSQYDEVDLGFLDIESNNFLANEQADNLYDTLNIDQQELLFLAYRDNNLKATKNWFLIRIPNSFSILPIS